MKFIEALAVFFLGMVFAIYLGVGSGLVAVTGTKDTVQTVNYKGHMYKLVPLEVEDY